MRTTRLVLAALVLYLLAACGGPPALDGTPRETATTWFVEVPGEGGVWLSPSDLAAMGLDTEGETPPRFRLAWGEAEIPYLPLREKGSWGVFLFAPDRSTRSSRRTAIRLEVGAEGSIMVGGASPGDEPGPGSDEPVTTTGLTTLRWEEDERYVPQAEAEVPWFWKPVRTPSSGGLTETVSLPDAVAGPVTVTLHLWSHTASSASPDHRLLLAWDGDSREDWTWDGQGMRRLTTSFDGSGEHRHTLTLRAPQLPGAEVALVWLDGWEVTYRRRVVADGSVWRAEGRRLQVPEAPPGVRVVDVTDPFEPRHLGPVSPEQAVAVTPGHRYWVGTPDEAAAPLALRPARTLDLDALGDVTYLAVAPPSFHNSLAELLDHRGGQGLQAEVVAPQAVYDTLGVGQPDPAALQMLVARLPSLEYLLVVGEATAEPGGYHGEEGALRVVTPFTRTAGLGETPADSLLGVDGQGALRAAVGRFPATTADEVEAMVAKTIRWEEEGAPPEALLVTDDEAEFADLADAIGESLPAGLSPLRLDVAQGDARAELLAELRGGRVWLNYTGHGSLTILCDQGLLTLDDADAWRDPALVVAWTCLAAHYAHPTQDSIGERWLREGQGGAAAFLGPVGETTTYQQTPFARRFYAAVEDEGRLGDAWLTALRAGSARDVRWGYVLLGDPALRLNLD